MAAVKANHANNALSGTQSTKILLACLSDMTCVRQVGTWYRGLDFPFKFALKMETPSVTGFAVYFNAMHIGQQRHSQLISRLSKVCARAITQYFALKNGCLVSHKIFVIVARAEDKRQVFLNTDGHNETQLGVSTGANFSVSLFRYLRLRIALLTCSIHANKSTNCNFISIEIPIRCHTVMRVQLDSQIHSYLFQLHNAISYLQSLSEQILAILFIPL